ncbi:MAG: GNAT family N-acetyltransferase [Pseudonocardiaceae bacterium]
MYNLTTDAGPQPVGTTALRIDHYVHTTENVILLGPKDRDQGLTGEATHHTLNYGFHITQLRAVWLKVLEHNTAAIRAYQAAEFKQIGRLRRASYWLSAECDEILMDTIPEDFPDPSAVRHLIES